MPKIVVFVDTGYSGADHEDEWDVPDDERELMSEPERNKLLNEMAVEFMGDCIDYGAYVKE